MSYEAYLSEEGIVRNPTLEVILEGLLDLLPAQDDMPGLGGQNMANSRAFREGKRKLKRALKKAYDLGRKESRPGRGSKSNVKSSEGAEA